MLGILAIKPYKELARKDEKKTIPETCGKFLTGRWFARRARIYNKTFSQMQIITVRIGSLLKIDTPVTLFVYRQKLKTRTVQVKKKLPKKQFAIFLVAIATKFAHKITRRY
jgi:hypothetical protein